MIRHTLLKLAVGAAFAAPMGHPVRVQTLTVVDAAGVPSIELAAEERAVEAQSAQLAVVWGTPRVRFGSGGWVVTLTDDKAMMPSDDSGFHSGGGGTQPAAGVLSGPGWTVRLSHEVLEMLVDPTAAASLNGKSLEVCDPVNSYHYMLDGVAVSDFVLPNWFSGRRGVADFADALGILGRN